MPVLSVYKSGKNGVIYGLKQLESAGFELDALWFNGFANDRPDFKLFKKYVRGLADRVNTNAQFDGFPDEHFRHELTRKEHAVWAIPSRDWTTPLHAYCIRWNQRTLIYLHGHLRSTNVPTQDDPDLKDSLRCWRSILDQLESRVGDGKEFRSYPDRGGLFLPEHREPEQLIKLEQW